MLDVQHHVLLPSNSLQLTVLGSAAPDDFPNDTSFCVTRLELNFILLRQKSHKISNLCLVIIHNGHAIDEESSESRGLGLMFGEYWMLFQGQIEQQLMPWWHLTILLSIATTVVFTQCLEELQLIQIIAAPSQEQWEVCLLLQLPAGVLRIQSR